jgi:hypothetical protein
MNGTKIRLSEKEMELLTNSDWILTKNGILNKAIKLLESIRDRQELILESVKDQLPSILQQASSKISKGENYKGLPYLVLDHPRHFEKHNFFAIRTMLWWGNFFSITLHLSGQHKKRYESKLGASFPVLQKNGFYACINDNEWEHHFEPGNYREMQTMTNNEFAGLLHENAFIKIANKIPLDHWDDASELLTRHFHELINAVAG